MADFFYVDESNQQVGPVPGEQVEEMIRSGRLGPGIYAWTAGLEGWKTLGEILPASFQASGGTLADMAPIPTPPSRPNTQFDILKSDLHQVPRIIVSQDEILLRPGVFNYLQGQFEVRSRTLREGIDFPVLKGNGVVYLKPTLGECQILELGGESWSFRESSFMACDRTLQLELREHSPELDSPPEATFRQLSVSGSGSVCFLSPGRLETLPVTEDALTVDGAILVAWSTGLELSIDPARQCLACPGEGPGQVIVSLQGSGTVLLAPAASRCHALLRELGLAQRG